MRTVVLVPVRSQARAGARPLNGNGAAPATHSVEDRLTEAVGLARAIALDVAAAEIVPLPRPRPATLFGSGKVQELATLVAEREAGLVIVDHTVSPVQQRNLEKAWPARC
jgi:GTP-binding protein HflX